MSDKVMNLAPTAFQRQDSDEELRMQTTEQISPLDRVTAAAFLDKLPRHIRDAFYARAAEIGYPIEVTCYAKLH